MSRLKNLLRVAGASTETAQQDRVQVCNPVAQRLHAVQQATSTKPIPERIRLLIATVIQLIDCRDSDRQAFADDWRPNPEGTERGLKHLADYYGGRHGH